MLEGHYSPAFYVVTRPSRLEAPTFSDRLFTFTKPFSADLWIALIILIAVTGCAYWLIENNSKRSIDFKQGDKWQHSLPQGVTLAFQAFTKVGASSTIKPCTRGGKLLSVCMGFVFTIMTASYTAKLAAAFTMHATVVQPISGIQDLITTGAATCIRTQEKEPLLALYPGLNVFDVGQQFEFLWEKFEQDSCLAMITTSTQVTAFQREGKCDMEIVGQTVMQDAEGWATNRDSWCVEQSFEYALRYLRDEGAIKSAFERWHPQATGCTAGAAQEEATSDKLHLVDMAGLFLLYGAVVTALVMGRLISLALRPVSSVRTNETEGDSEVVTVNPLTVKHDHEGSAVELQSTVGAMGSNIPGQTQRE